MVRFFKLFIEFFLKFLINFFLNRERRFSFPCQ